MVIALVSMVAPIRRLPGVILHPIQAPTPTVHPPLFDNSIIPGLVELSSQSEVLIQLQYTVPHPARYA
jgi:hypothetical protein